MIKMAKTGPPKGSDNIGRNESKTSNIPTEKLLAIADKILEQNKIVFKRLSEI